ncbi:MAG TPA: hypothetical protein VN604_05660 [Nitrospirota bacterium]|nr:hypothetical protein [Nitrospirota bacterium]
MRKTILAMTVPDFFSKRAGRGAGEGDKLLLPGFAGSRSGRRIR